MTYEELIEIASMLASESGENEEYDRALCEFIMMIKGLSDYHIPKIKKDIMLVK